MIIPNDPSEPASPVSFPQTDLRAFYIEEGGEHWYYAARDDGHAMTQWLEDLGCKSIAEYFGDDPHPISCSAVPDDQEITIANFDEPDTENESTRTAREWIVYFGEGCICTSVY